MNGIPMLILSVGSIIAVLFFVTYASQKHNLNSIKDKTVGNGQHGTARWATRQEIQRTYHHVPFAPEEWRQAAKNRNQPTANGKPLPQGIVLGCQGGRKKIYGSSTNPFSLSLVYNSDYFARSSADYCPPSKLGLSMNVGSGWTLDCIQRVEAETISNISYV